MTDQQRLEMKISGLILEVAEAAHEMPWSDVQGFAIVKAREAITLVKEVV